MLHILNSITIFFFWLNKCQFRKRNPPSRVRVWRIWVWIWQWVQKCLSVPVPAIPLSAYPPGIPIPVSNTNRFTPSMTIIASKWSQSLENFVIGTRSTCHSSSNVTFISLSTLKIFAENCPELRFLQLNTTTIPPFDHYYHPTFQYI
jgi:hypothetical protein